MKAFTLYCDTCKAEGGISWGTYTKSEMANHLKKKHPEEWVRRQLKFEEENPFVCKVKNCGKRFATKIEVERHMDKLH